MLTLHEIKKRNKRFWAEQNVRTRDLLTDPFLCVRAFAAQEEESRRLPISHRRSLDALLNEVHDSSCGALRVQARRGGLARRSNRLQRHIEDIIRQCPDITGADLCARLKNEVRPGGFIFDMDEEEIFFLDEKGGQKTAKIAGLKNRLWRGKKKLFPKSG